VSLLMNSLVYSCGDTQSDIRFPVAEIVYWKYADNRSCLHLSGTCSDADPGIPYEKVAVRVQIIKPEYSNLAMKSSKSSRYFTPSFLPREVKRTDKTLSSTISESIVNVPSVYCSINTYFKL